MKESELVKAIVSGTPLIVVEYRKADGDQIRLNATKTRAASIAPVAKHVVLVGDVSYELTEWLPEGGDFKAVKGTFPRGTKIAVEVESLERTDYGNRISGAMVPVEWGK